LRIIATAADDSSGHYRIRQPINAIHDSTVQIKVVGTNIGLPLMVNRRTGRFAGIELNCDVLVLQRPMFYLMPDMIEHVQACGTAVVVELDDDFHTPDANNRAFMLNHPRVNPQYNFRWLGECVKRADMVTVSTDWLAKRYGSHGRVAVIRNYVDDEMTRIRRRGNGTTLGWAGTTINHPNDLPATRGGVGAAMRERPGWRFLCVGGEGHAEQIIRQLDLNPARFIASPWKTLELHHLLVAQLDLGIVPLADTKFNYAKCLDAETRVMTDSGVRPIVTIGTQDRVLRAGRWRQVQAVSREPVCPGLEVETGFGYRLRLTPNHRLLADGEWVQAGRLRTGMRLAFDREEWPQAIPYVKVPWPAESRRSRAGFAEHAFIEAESGPQITLDERWGRLLGLFVGDGSASGKTAICYSCDGQDADLIELLVSDWRQVGLNATTEAVTTYSGQVLRRRSVRIASALLTRFLAHLGLLETPAAREARRRVIRIPDVIWTSPRSVVTAFLAGLFEADGTVARTGISFTTKSEVLARDVQRLLMGLGMVSRCHAKPHSAQDGVMRSYWHVALRRASADVFAREIGFLSARKRQRLNAIVRKPHSNAYRSMPEHDEIAVIRPCLVQPVDLQVEGEEFAAAGIVSHNSWLKGLEYAALGVPFVASDLPEYQLLAQRYKIGHLARSKSRLWRRELGHLMDSDYRDEIGSDYRARVADHLTIESNAYRWLEAWRQAWLNRRLIRATHTTTQGGQA
jgi:intein/homing endonuclease